jgi:parvulin-like peptidyl-prolyl isomerase
VADFNFDNFDLRPENLIPFLSSQQVLAPILREMIIDRAIASIAYEPGDIANLPEDINQADAAIRQYKIQQFKHQQWGNQLEQYFLQRKRHLDQVVYSMIRTAEAGLTQELYFRAQEQEASFADLARNYSQGPEALTNGIVGPVAIVTLPPQIGLKLAGMQPGKVCTPIKFQNQWVIFKLERCLPAQLNDKTKQMLLNEQFEAWVRATIAPQLQRSSQQTSTQQSCNNSDLALAMAA